VIVMNLCGTKLKTSLVHSGSMILHTL
jgi:hypothetical protein